MDLQTADGRVHILRFRDRLPWRRHENRRGALVTTWHAYDTVRRLWIARERPNLRALIRELARLGYDVTPPMRRLDIGGQRR